MNDPKEQAIRVIRDEHRSISAVLHGLRQLAEQAKASAVKPDFGVFRAMICYIDEFPERLHHPKEDRQLFARIAARTREGDELLGTLREEHLASARLIRDLEHSVLAFEQHWPAGAAGFSTAVQAYADFHWKHMRKEETQLLPLAERVLAPEDWQAIAEAFLENRDPIARVAEKDFEQLFSKIVAIAPEPVGLGARWQKEKGAG